MTTAVAALLPLALRPRPALTGRRIVASLLPPEQAAFSSLSGPMALSPDGRQLAFVARGPGGKTMLWLRSLDGETARAVAGTEGAFDPFWSPDGRFVAFFARGKLWRIEAQGGEAKALADSRDSAGGAWAPDGTILFANVWGGGSLMRIEPNGKVSPLIDAHGTSNRRWPHFLPGGRRFLYTVVSQFGSEDGIYLGSLDSSESRRVVPAVSNAVYAEPGIVLYWRDGDLRARRLEAAGAREEDERVAEQVQFDPDRSCALFSAGAGGLLAYRSGGRAGTSELVFVDRAGRDLASLGAPAYYYSPRLSRDGRRLAVDISDPLRANGDIWIFDVARGVSSRFTHDPANESSPLWSPDDRQIVFFRGLDLYRRASSAAAGEELLLGSADLKRASDWSEDGRFLLFSPLGTQRNYDIWVLSIADSKARPWLSTAFNEEGARLSPDGRWIAYTSDESSRFEVYVQGFPEPGEKVLVSVSGGGSPVWRRDGKELFYQAADGKLMAVPVKTSPRFEAEAPRSLFDAPVRGPIGIVPHQYDVSADGQRFLLNRMSAESAAPITLIQGWAAGLPGSR
jgi:Tol biopolymer transport system component